MTGPVKARTKICKCILYQLDTCEAEVEHEQYKLEPFPSQKLEHILTDGLQKNRFLDFYCSCSMVCEIALTHNYCSILQKVKEPRDMPIDAETFFLWSIK